MKQGNRRDIILSLLKSALILALCICINLFGILTSKVTHSVLFIDLCGTAVASLVYGPIHGALVGMTSNYLGQFYLGPALGGIYGINLDHYFIFGPVHMLAALVWSIVPRLLKGRFATDLFCDNKDHYPCGKLFIGIVCLALLSDIAASISAAIITQAYKMGCLASEVYVSDFTCNLQILISRPNAVLHDQFLRLIVARVAMGFPDHIISFATAVLIVSHVLKGRRYIMAGKFGNTIITNRPFVASLYFMLLVFTMYKYVRLSLSEFGSDPTIASLLILFAFVISVLAIIISKQFELVVFIKDGDYRKHIYQEINVEMRDAFEDCLNFAIIFSVGLFYWLEWLKSSRSDTIVQFFQDKISGALGVAFLISIIKFQALIFAHIFRYVRQYSEDVIHDFIKSDHLKSQAMVD